MKKKILKPLDLFVEFGGKSSDPDINPEFMKPKMFMFRLQKIMDEYAGGVTSGFKTNKAKLERALELSELAEGRLREAGRRGSARTYALP